MKVKVLQRDDAEFIGRHGQVQKYFRNADPALHPFERSKEYTRALRAVKLEKIFAKPFVCAMDGHTDTVMCLGMARMSGAALVSGSAAGELRSWNLQRFKPRSYIPKAHEGFLRDLVVSPSGENVITCGDDDSCKMWSLDTETGELGAKAKAAYFTPSRATAVDHHWKQNIFATAGSTVDVWDYSRSSPLSRFEWGCDKVITARFNPAEPALIASTGVDRSIGLYDLRGSSAIRKVILKMRSNEVCWNPMAPLNFIVANEDCNLYTFDMRKLNKALQRHWDHVMPVLDVNFSPSGQEFVSSSYDGTVRLWSIDQQRSRDVYHSKRMQRVFACNFTPDGRFVLTASEDTNIRVWKAKADQKLGSMDEREKRAQAYRETLKKRFSRLPEIGRIKRHKHVPKMVKSLTTKRRIMKESRDRKAANRRKHSKPGMHPHVPKKQAMVLQEEE